MSTALHGTVSGVEVVDGLGRVLEIQVLVASRIEASDLAAPSACVGWTIGDVITHSVGVTRKFTAFASGQTDRPRTPGDTAFPDGHVAALRVAAKESKAAWGSTDLSRSCHLSFGTFTADEAA